MSTGRLQMTVDHLVSAQSMGQSQAQISDGYDAQSLFSTQDSIALVTGGGTGVTILEMKTSIITVLT
jgi:hypothetical protein